MGFFIKSKWDQTLIILCHFHYSGLARKEYYPFVTYYCPHCNALNRPNQTESGHITGSISPTVASSVVEEDDGVPNAEDTVSATNSLVAAEPAVDEISRS